MVLSLTVTIENKFLIVSAEGNFLRPLSSSFFLLIFHSRSDFDSTQEEWNEWNKCIQCLLRCCRLFVHFVVDFISHVCKRFITNSVVVIALFFNSLLRCSNARAHTRKFVFRCHAVVIVTVDIGSPRKRINHKRKCVQFHS